MPRNEGTTDRMIRAAIGAALVLLALTGVAATPFLFWGGLVVGAVLLATAATGYCPAYGLFGIRTCRT